LISASTRSSHQAGVPGARTPARSVRDGSAAHDPLDFGNLSADHRCSDEMGSAGSGNSLPYGEGEDQACQPLSVSDRPQLLLRSRTKSRREPRRMFSAITLAARLFRVAQSAHARGKPLLLTRAIVRHARRNVVPVTTDLAPRVFAISVKVRWH